MDHRADKDIFGDYEVEEVKDQIHGDANYEIRKLGIAGAPHDKWYWHKNDIGAWHGPAMDWNTGTYAGHYENFVEKIPYSDRGTVITAGGAMGMYARGYAGLFESVYVFEPYWENFHALVRNNFYENVHFFNAALSSKPGMGYIRSHQENNYGMFQLKAASDIVHGHIPIMTIDQLALRRCDLIQLDLEGAEFEALKGAKRTIEKFMPVVVTEGNDPNTLRLLEGFGYVYDGCSHADAIYRKKEEL